MRKKRISRPENIFPPPLPYKNEMVAPQRQKQQQQKTVYNELVEQFFGESAQEIQNKNLDETPTGRLLFCRVFRSLAEKWQMNSLLQT